MKKRQTQIQSWDQGLCPLGWRNFKQIRSSVCLWRRVNTNTVREARLWHKEQGGRGYGILLDEGGRFDLSGQEQTQWGNSSSHKYLWRSYDGHFLHTVSTLALSPPWRALPFLHGTTRIWDFWCDLAQVNTYITQDFTYSGLSLLPTEGESRMYLKPQSPGTTACRALPSDPCLTQVFALPPSVLLYMGHSRKPSLLSPSAQKHYLFYI